MSASAQTHAKKMGIRTVPVPAKLITSIFSADAHRLSIIEAALIKKFGPLDFQSPVIDFKQTRYYEDEFGPGLKRKFISFKKLIKTENLWKIKLFTNGLEQKFAAANKRSVNIDPGYLTRANLILASTKMFFHRVHLNKGIYAEVTLIYQNKMFKAFSWTYPDYQSDECTAFFQAIRALLCAQLKK